MKTPKLSDAERITQLTSQRDKLAAQLEHSLLVNAANTICTEHRVPRQNVRGVVHVLKEAFTVGADGALVPHVEGETLSDFAKRLPDYLFQKHRKEVNPASLLTKRFDLYTEEERWDLVAEVETLSMADD